MCCFLAKAKWEDWLWRWCVAMDYMFVCQPDRGWRLCFPLWLRAGGSDFRLYDGSDLKTYLLMGWCGPDALTVVRPTGVYQLDFFCSGVRFCVLLGPFLCFVSF